MEGIEFLRRVESIIIVECPRLKNIRGVEELEGLKEMIISDSPAISCLQRLQRLPSELTTMVGRPAMADLQLTLQGCERRSSMSYFNADKLGDTLSMVDAYCEIDLKCDVKEMIHSFHKTHNSFSEFIFCAMVWNSPRIRGNILYESRIVLDKSYYVSGIKLSRSGQDWIYTCMVCEERFSEYESWMPSPHRLKKAFLMGVKADEERKSLHILQTLFSQLCIQNSKCILDSDVSDSESEFKFNDYRNNALFDCDDLAVYAHNDEELNGGDDDHDNDNVNEF